MNIPSSILKVLVGATALAGLTAGAASAAPGAPAALVGEGTAVITGAKSATITNDVGEYGAVYTKSNLNTIDKKNKGRLIGRVDFSFDSSGDVAGGAPRFSLGIDENDDGVHDGFAFIDVNGCGSTTVSTESATCTVYYGLGTFANWDAFAAAHPTYRSVYVPFIIADQAGTYYLTNIDVK